MEIVVYKLTNTNPKTFQEAIVFLAELDRLHITLEEERGFPDLEEVTEQAMQILTEATGITDWDFLGDCTLDETVTVEDLKAWSTYDDEPEEDED